MQDMALSFWKFSQARNVPVMLLPIGSSVANRSCRSPEGPSERTFGPISLGSGAGPWNRST